MLQSRITLLRRYAAHVDGGKLWQVINECSPEAERMRNARANCALDTSKLQSMYPQLRNASDGVREAILTVQNFANVHIFLVKLY